MNDDETSYFQRTKPMPSIPTSSCIGSLHGLAYPPGLIDDVKDYQHVRVQTEGKKITFRTTNEIPDN